MDRRKAPSVEEAALACCVTLAGEIEDDDTREKFLDWLGDIQAAQNARARKLEFDARSRRLVGAMVPVIYADRVKDLAERSERSVYEFVLEALEREVARTRKALRKKKE